MNANSPSPLAGISATAKTIFQYPVRSKTEIAAPSTSAKRVGSEPSPTDSVQSLAPDSSPAQLGLPDSNDLNRVSGSTVSFGDERSAYEQGRYDAMHATYQQPVARTYSNLQPPPQPNYVRQNQPQVYDPAPQPMMAQPTPAQPYNQPTYSQQMVQQNQRQNYAGQPGYRQYSNQTELNRPTEIPVPAVGNMSPPELATSPIYQHPIEPQQTGTGHFANGINMVGTGLRLDFKTATEIAYDLQDQVVALQKQLGSSNTKIEQLSKKIQAALIWQHPIQQD